MECDILDCLEQLGYDGALQEEKSLLAAANGSLSAPELAELCRWLTSRLTALCGLQECVTPAPDDTDSLQLEVGVLLKELHCPYQDVVSGILKGAVLTTTQHLKLLLFLSSELQAAQISKSRRPPDGQRDGNPVAQEILTMCETLKLTFSRRRDATAVLSQIHDQVEEELRRLPDGSVGNPVLRKSLSSDQWAALHDINAALSSEYECRRRMLIKRLDVTVQSFGWSDRAKVKVDTMASAYQPRRHALWPQPSVGVAELLAAREDICNVVKTSSGSIREKTVCAVNKILMGRVPDRGGRPSEIEAPPPEMPPWQKRQDGGGRGGGRGGWGRGGGGGGWGRGGGGGGWGGGGGGGWRGGHGGKRGRYQY